MAIQVDDDGDRRYSALISIPSLGKQLLWVGRPTLMDDTPSFWLEYIHSVEAFSGTQSMRDVVQMSQSTGCEGRIHLIAKFVSHIFYLKMGFIPSGDARGSLPCWNMRKINYVQDYFTPALFKILSQATSSSPRPNTEELGPVFMSLSEAGRERWRVAIKEEKSFEPFRKFEPLQSLMTATQSCELERIMSIHKTAS